MTGRSPRARGKGLMELLRDDTPHPSARTGAVVIGLVALVLVAAITHYVPLLSGSSGQEVRAEFLAANQVNQYTPVRVDGVRVGTVKSIGPGDSANTSLVTMSIDEHHLKLHSDASASVRWRTILGGNMFVDVQPGSASAPPLGGAVIPASHTSSQVELDQLVQIYAGRTAEDQRAMLRGLRATFTDAAGIGRTIRTAGPSLATIGRGLAPLRGSQTDDLRQMVASTARTATGLGQDPAALQALVDNADRALAVADARRLDIDHLLALAPSSLHSMRTTLARLMTTLAHLDPVVARLRVAAPLLAPAANAATPTLRQAQILLSKARPLLADATPTFIALARASATGVPLIHGLSPTVNRLNSDILPFLRRRDNGTQLLNYEAIGPFFSSIDSIASSLNAAGHMLQFAVAPGPNSVLPLNSRPATAAALTAHEARQCRARVAPRARPGCSPAAQLVAHIFGAAK